VCPVSTSIKAYWLNPVARLYWAGWDNEYVVFEETSGQTHELDPLRALVLNAAIGGPIHAASVLADLAADLPEMRAEVSIERLNQIFAEFETVGLFESESV